MAFSLKLKLNHLLKMHGYPQFSFWIPRVLTKIYFLRIVLNHAKNNPGIVSIGDRKSQYLEMHRTYAQ